MYLSSEQQVAGAELDGSIRQRGGDGKETGLLPCYCMGVLCEGGIGEGPSGRVSS